MDDEFKLCWKNFQDNIACGFQSLYDRGDLVDVTLACDGKLLQAHKIVLAICSPYFQEIFISNPCKHPIIILKDVSYNIMCELLEFMYQGVVNVKHTELQAFMKIGQLLQIKGLATNSSSSSASTSSDKSSNPSNSNTKNEVEPSLTSKPAIASANETSSNAENSNSDDKPSTGNSNSNTPQRSQSPTLSPATSPMNTSVNDTTTSKSNDSHIPSHHTYHGSSSGGSSGVKRLADYNSDTLSIYSRNKLRRSITSTEPSSENNDGPDAGGMDHMNTEDFFLPHISMVESRYDLNSIKRESAEHHQNAGAASAAAVAAAASASLRNSFNSAAFGLDYTTFYKNNSGSAPPPPPPPSGQEYPNELHMANEYSKSFANHMDIPPIGPGEHWYQGKLEFMLSQRGKPLLVHDGHTFGIQYVRKDKKYWQCNLSRKFNCKARVTTTDTGEIIVTNNEHCHTEIRQHLRKDYQRHKVMMNALINLSTNRLAVENFRRHNSIANNLSNLQQTMVAATSTTPLALQSHIEGTADQNVEGTLLDLGKRSTLSMENDDQLKHHHHQHHHRHHLHHHQLQLQQQQQHPVNDVEDDVENDEPLDCGLRSSSNRDHSERDGSNIKNENNDAQQTSNNINNDRNDEWQCKNEAIQ